MQMFFWKYFFWKKKFLRTYVSHNMLRLDAKVSNGTGHSCLAGQRDRSFFIVSGQRDKVKIFLRDDRDGILTLCHGTGRNFDILPWDGILTACPVPENPGTATGQKEKKSKKLQF